MGDEIVFSTVSKCFASIDRDAWNALTQGAVWADFLDASRRLLQQGAKLGEDESPASRAHRWIVRKFKRKKWLIVPPKAFIRLQANPPLPWNRFPQARKS